MKSYVPIDGTKYDCVEVACLDRYDIEVVTVDGLIRGKAMTTKVNKAGELLIVESDGRRQISIHMDNIRQIAALSTNRRFDEVSSQD